MPLYDYKCDSCGKEWEEYAAVVDKDVIKCSSCMGQAHTLITINSIPNVFMEQYDEGLEAMVTGPGHRQTLMKERGYEEI